jgi:excinuclease ABC subunit C
MVCAVEGLPDRRRYRRFRMRGFEGPDDPRMIAQAVTRRYSRLRDEGQPMPDLVILDGGVTQLRAARAALKDIGVSLPTCGLAKQFELLVRDDGRPPAELPRDSDGLMVVTRLRDEAHRFAITYHRSLRNKTIRESVLDDIPGIGEAKKTLLLRTFGSISRLARAGRDEIARLPGIGEELADAILRAVPSAPPPDEEGE